MEPFVVVVERQNILRMTYGYVLAIQSTQDMVELPFLTKLLSYPLPFLWTCGTDNDLIMVLINDGLIHFSDQQTDGPYIRVL